MKIHKGDQIKVVCGKESGKTGKVLSVDIEKRRLLVERLNMVRKHTKPNPRTNPQGGVLEREAAIHVSNVMLVCPSCGQPTRVGYRILESGSKVRVCRRKNCNSPIDKA